MGNWKTLKAVSGVVPPRKPPKRARRVTIWRDPAGLYHYTVQAGNWFIIDESEQGFTRKASVTKRVADRWPHAEEVIDQT